MLYRNTTTRVVLLASLWLGAEARLGKVLQNHQLLLSRGRNNNDERVLQVVNLEGFGGNPPDDVLPLSLCQGDCDDDVDVSTLLFIISIAADFNNTGLIYTFAFVLTVAFPFLSNYTNLF